VIDVIHRADVLAQLEQLFDRRVKVRSDQVALFELVASWFFEQLMLNFSRPPREVILAGSKKIPGKTPLLFPTSADHQDQLADKIRSELPRD